MILFYREGNLIIYFKEKLSTMQVDTSKEIQLKRVLIGKFNWLWIKRTSNFMI